MTIAEIGSAAIENAPYLVGFIMPPFVEFLNKDVRKEHERYIVAMLSCFIVAIFIHWNDIANGRPEHFVFYAGLIFTESNTIFKLYFADSWIRGKMHEKFGKSPASEGLDVSPAVSPVGI